MFALFVVMADGIISFVFRSCAYLIDIVFVPLYICETVDTVMGRLNNQWFMWAFIFTDTWYYICSDT